MAINCRHHDVLDAHDLWALEVQRTYRTLEFLPAVLIRERLSALGMTSSDANAPWAYSFDTTFSDPVFSPETIREHGSKRPVALHADNIRPHGGFAAALSNNTSNQTKIIYTLRHGNTPHNEDSETWGKAVAWRYLSGLQKNFDPQITQTGVAKTTLASQILSGMIRTESAPRPVTIYSSPLRRCIETSMHMIKHAGWDHPSPDGRWPPVTLKVKEGLREWMGYGHGHNSDRHGSRADIQTLVEELKAALGLSIAYQLDVPENERLHDEIYVDVDRRVRSVLNDIFDGASSGSCVMLVLHGRSNKSFLRVLGHQPAQVDNFEMANCALLPYRVTRRWLNDSETSERARDEDAQGNEDQREVEYNKRARDSQAVQEVRCWNADPVSRHRLETLWNLLNLHAGNGDPAAAAAQAMLQNDLKQSQY